jgi:transcription termination factor NusB
MKEEEETYDFSSQEPNFKKYDLSKCEIKYGDEIPDPEGLLFMGTFLVLSRGNISTVKGKAKARKSFFIAYLLQQVFEQNPDVSALLIDTEQSKTFVYKVLKRVYKLMDWTHENNRLKVLSLREYEVIQRREILLQAVAEYKSDFIVLDGGVDIVNDFNNTDESKQVVGVLMKLSTDYNCHIVNVLHEGKSNGELRGHFGAEMLNKSETVFEVVKDGEVSKVLPYATKNAPFEEFSFMINEHGLPIYNGTIEKASKKEQNEMNMKFNFTKLLAPNKMLEYEALAGEYKEIAGCEVRTAKSHISKMLKAGFIRKAGSMYVLTGLE